MKNTDIAMAIVFSVWLIFFAFCGYKELWAVFTIGTLATLGVLVAFSEVEI